MPYMVSPHAQSAARQIAEDLALRGFTVAQTTDASGNPCVTFGAMTAGSQSGTIRIKMDTLPSNAVDGVGNSQRVYSPHILDLILETSTLANVSLLTAANMFKVQYELFKHAIRIDVYMTANTTAPTLANIPGSASFSIDRLWFAKSASM